MSPQTLFCFACLSFVLASRRMKSGGILSELAYVGTGSQISRILLPFVLAVPLAVFGTIAYLDHVEVMPLTRGEAISAPVLVLLALAVIVWMGRRINILEGDLMRQSITDQLTGVLNRRGLEVVSAYMLPNMRHRGGGAVVFFFDLDGLKELNDTEGHDAGSRLIVNFAECLVATFRADDLVARVGGDEFVVLAAGTTTTADDILARLNYLTGRKSGDAPAIAYSAGVAPVAADAEGLDDALMEADMNMYRDKEARRARRAGPPTLAPAERNTATATADRLRNSA